MKKIVFVTRHMEAGGAERVIAQLAKNFTEKGIQCTVVTLVDGEVFCDLPAEVKIYAIGQKSPRSYIDKFFKYIEVRRYIKLLQSDIVLTLPEDVGIYLIAVMLGTGIPVVVSERNNPWVMPQKKVTRFLRKLFYPLADGFIFQTKQAASFFSKGIQEKGIVLHNPLDLERIPEPWQRERRKEVVGAGRFEQQKNFPLLIRSFSAFHKTHPDYTLVIYGDGSLRKELETLSVALLPEDSYSLPGTSHELLARMDGASMFVLSSDYEGMPNVVIEAMAMGMPVISTDCPSGGPAELIESGTNGLLVPVNDKKAITEAMCFIADNPEKAAAIGGDAAMIKNDLDADKIADRWRAYLEWICDK